MADNQKAQATSPTDILMVQLLQAGIIAQNNFITVNKVLDYDHLEYKRRLSITEAMAIDSIWGGSSDSEQ